MWLVYPVTADDTRKARRGVLVLLAGSAVWYGAVAAVLAVWADPVLYKVQSKFAAVPEPAKTWTPFVVLLAAFLAAGLLRLVGYRLCRNAAGAVGAGDGLALALLGGAVWLAACGTVYFGFTGFLAVVTGLGTALELKYVRFPVQLFGMVVSPEAVRRVGWYFYARTVWLAAVLAAGLLLLAAHILTDLPKNPGGPYEATVNRVNAVLRVLFNAAAGAAVIALPAVTAGYWAMLYGVYGSVDRLLDPNGPVVDPVPPVKEGFDQLKHLLQNPLP